MDKIAISKLPEELMLNVFAHLDSSIPPSAQKIRREPTLDLTKSTYQPLKDVSSVCKRWRRIALPLLFRHARLQLDVAPQEHWAKCAACSQASQRQWDQTDPGIFDVESYHVDMVKAFQQRPMLLQNIQHSSRAVPNLSTTRESFERPDEASTAGWAWRFYHALEDFCHFIDTSGIASSVRSVVVVSGKMLQGKLGRFPHQSAGREWRYAASAAFWPHLFSVINPERVVILAPPTELACLTNASIDTFGDWAFGDMDFHILELTHDRDMARDDAGLPVEYSKLKPFPIQHPTFATSSLLYLRQWTHLGLNEGSFLRAYGTYEYFERGPPSLVSSIKRCLSPAVPNLTRGPSAVCLSALRSFTYTAIFPFANHAYFAEWLLYLEELDVQFAPDPQSGILDDKDRIGRAQLQDCWQELLSAYQPIATAATMPLMSTAKLPKLQRITCRDFQIPMLRADLEEIFLGCCLPVWVEWEPGVFERQASSLRVSDLPV